jgi:hypothetical protein
MNDTDKRITAGVAAKVATDLLGFSLAYSLSEEQVLELYGSLHDRVTTRLISQAESLGTPEFVPTVVAQAFPATVGETHAHVVQAPGPVATSATVVQLPTSFVPAPSAGPAAVPFASQGGADPQVEQAWNQFFADVEAGPVQFAANWEDNRGSKRGENSPDFKHKTWKLAGEKYTVSLWINGKKNPSWLPDRLRSIGL